MNPKVSILISARDQLTLTKKCIDCIDQTLDGSVPYEVLIANDASTDGTAQYLNGLSFPHRVFHREKKSYGFAKNNNWLASEANGEYLLFLNNDAFVKGDWLIPMLDVFQNYPKAGFVGNVQKLFGTRRYDHMGVVFSPLGNPRHYGQGFLHRPFKGEVRRWSAVTAACCMIKSELFRDLGGFDEQFLNGCEDIDLCIRMNRAGYNHYVVHDSVIDHVKGATTGRKDRNEENFELLMEKWDEEIRKNESVSDAFYHARTYLFRPLYRPFDTNFIKLVDALLILLRIRKLSAL